MPHREDGVRTGMRSDHRSMQDADYFDALVERILAGWPIEPHEVPRRLRPLLSVTTLLASCRPRRTRW